MTADLDDIFRREAGRLIPYLLRRLGPRHFDLAEDAVQDAFVAALRHWPTSGVPDDPRSWLLRAAHRKALDRLKRDHTAQRKAHLLLGDVAPAATLPDRGLPDEIAVLLLACHPALPRENQVALALRTLGGLSTPEVARALLISEAAAAQRIVRAKRELERLGMVALSVAEVEPLEPRLDAVMDVLYLIYNEGHHATEGADLIRLHLVGDAIRLAEMLVSASLTARPRGHALLALMHFGASRLAARTDDLGDLVVLEDQDRGRWDPAHRNRAFHHLDLSARGTEVSRFHLEAGIAAIHAGAVEAAATDWAGILSLYDELAARWPSPIVALNRAVAVLHVHGPEAAEGALAPVQADPSLARYAPLHAVAAELARRRGDAARASALFDRALACPGSDPQRRFLERRKAAIGLSPRPA